MSPGHSAHHVPKKYNIGLKDKDQQPIRIPPPLCPDTLKAMNDCFKAKGNQHECRFIIRAHNDCEWRMNYMQW